MISAQEVEHDRIERRRRKTPQSVAVRIEAVPVLRAPRALSDTGVLDKDAGNLILTDRQMIGWYASDGGDANSPTGFGKMLFRIRQDNSHPYETNFDASGNVCWYWGTSTSNRAMQFGDANGGSHYIYLHSGYASS